MDETNVDHLDPTAKFMELVKIGIQGMTCHQCVQKIEAGLGKIDGVQDVHVDLDRNTATVRFDNRKTNVPALHDALLKAGYRPAPEPFPPGPSTGFRQPG